MNEQNSGVKRKREEDCSSHGYSSLTSNNSAPKFETNQVKKKAEEGYSWWTCLQLDMSLSNTKPQPARNGTL